MIQSAHLARLERALDASSLRQRVIADNLANVDTPNYKSKQVTFENELKQALSGPSSTFTGYRTDPRHIQIGRKSPDQVQARVVTNHNTLMNNNGNNVDIDYEVTQMSKNNLWYQALVQQTNGHFHKLRLAIEGRGS